MAREVLFVAGEASGDAHAAAVARALRAHHPQLSLVGAGGDAMASAGVTLLAHTSRSAVMGFAAIAGQVPRLWSLYRQLQERLASGSVAVVVLVDFGGFNLTFVAAAARAANVPVLYYITPQVWASRAGRIDVMRRTVTRAAVIFPFEETLLRSHGVDAVFVGHPLADRLATLPTRAEARMALGIEADARLLALFPGSRPGEIERHLAAFAEAARVVQRRVPDLRVIVSAAPTVSIDPAACSFPVVRAPSLTLLRAADAAICKSGTTTLEAAVAGCPHVIGYRMGALDYAIARRVVRISRIGLVNIVAGREVAPEFVQDAFDAEQVAAAVTPLLDKHSSERATMLAGLDAVRASLGSPGAAARVAHLVAELAGA